MVSDKERRGRGGIVNVGTPPTVAGEVANDPDAAAKIAERVALGVVKATKEVAGQEPVDEGKTDKKD